MPEVLFKDKYLGYNSTKVQELLEKIDAQTDASEADVRAIVTGYEYPDDSSE